jgi:hypothetical protein
MTTIARRLTQFAALMGAAILACWLLFSWQIDGLGDWITSVIIVTVMLWFWLDANG